MLVLRWSQRAQDPKGTLEASKGTLEAPKGTVPFGKGLAEPCSSPVFSPLPLFIYNTQSSVLPQTNLRGGFDDSGMFAHPQVVVAAPHRDVPSFIQIGIRTGEMFGRRKFASRTSEHTKTSVRVVINFGLQFVAKMGIVVELSISCRQKRNRM